MMENSPAAASRAAYESRNDPVSWRTSFSSGVVERQQDYTVQIGNHACDKVELLNVSWSDDIGILCNIKSKFVFKMDAEIYYVNIDRLKTQLIWTFCCSQLLTWQLLVVLLYWLVHKNGLVFGQSCRLLILGECLQSHCFDVVFVQYSCQMLRLWRAGEVFVWIFCCRVLNSDAIVNISRT